MPLGHHHNRDTMRFDILKGVRILDFTRVLAGPYATRILADFGAEVIKVQSKNAATGAEHNDSAYFKTWNRNKKSITLNMAKKEARQLVRSLATISDIVVENFSPRVMANWNLTYEHLSQVRSDLIMLSMSCMGQSGPWKDYIGFGPTVQSFAGFTGRCVCEDAGPVGAGNSFADPVSGLYGAIALLAALENRDRTGNGQYIDLSEYEAMVSMGGQDLMLESLNPGTVKMSGNQFIDRQAAPYGCFPCKGKDEWCVIAVSNDDEWRRFCSIMDQPDLLLDEAFATLEDRVKNRKALDAIIDRWTANYAASDLVALLRQNSITAGVVQDAEKLANDPHLIENRFFVSFDHPVYGRVFGDRSPIRLDTPYSEEGHAAPLLGEDNSYVFRELLGLDEDTIQELVRTEVIS